ISLTNQTLSLIMLHQNKKFENEIIDLPRKFDELNSVLHLESMGIKIDKLSDVQYEYMGLKPGEPLKPNNYRY
ncbi:adenosylhomocysteinase, partial [Macrococcus capreoli]|uniref:adenosylhomocysteinase n=1 Tax=Macrococcus capreoli TaxID=2982690 RepID=UPI003EE69C50